MTLWEKVSIATILLVLIVFTAGSELVVRADPADDLVWVGKAPMPIPTHGAAVTAGPGGKIFALGGSHDLWGYTDTTFQYDPASDVWEVRNPMPTARGGIGVGSSNGMIYAVGGIPSPGAWSLSTNEAYDPVTDTWTTKASMPTARFNVGSATSSDGKIYVIGGQSYPGQSGGVRAGYWDWHNTLEVYDPTTNSWETKTPMPTYRTAVAAVAANGNIYAIGGETSDHQISTSVHEYNPTTDQWIPRASLNIGREWAAAVLASNGRIYVCGGFVNLAQLPTDTVEEYDPVTDTWSLVTSMPFALWAQGAAAPTSGRFYVMGGTDNSASMDTVLEATIIPAADQAALRLQDLITDVKQLNLQVGLENSLDAKIQAALSALADVNAHNDAAASNSMQAFINAVEAQRGKNVTNADADILIAAAQAIINLLQSSGA